MQCVKKLKKAFVVLLAAFFVATASACSQRDAQSPAADGLVYLHTALIYTLASRRTSPAIKRTVRDSFTRMVPGYLNLPFGRLILIRYSGIGKH